MLLQVLLFAFNLHHFIQGGQAAPKHFGGMTEEVVTPQGRVEESNTGCSNEGTCNREGQLPEQFILVCTVGTPYIHQHWCHTSLCCIEPVPARTSLRAGAKDPFPIHQRQRSQAQQDMSTAASLQLSSSHHELGALWTALSVLRWLNNRQLLLWWLGCSIDLLDKPASRFLLGGVRHIIAAAAVARI